MGTYELTSLCRRQAGGPIKGSQDAPGRPAELPFDLKANKAASAGDANKQALAQKAMETGQISDELARQLTPEQKAQMQKQIDADAAQRKKNSALNQAYNDGIDCSRRQEL